FGGTLLGAGGLVRAYTAGVEQAVAAATLLRRTELVVAQIEVSMADVGVAENAVRAWAAAHGALVEATDYGMRGATLTVLVAPEQLADLAADTSRWSSGRAEAREVSRRSADVPLTCAGAGARRQTAGAGRRASGRGRRSKAERRRTGPGAAPLGGRGGHRSREAAMLGGQAVDDHDDQRTDHGEQDRPQAPGVVHDAANAITAEQPADEPADDRADHTEDDGQSQAHRLLAGHEGPGDEADDAADDDPRDNESDESHRCVSFGGRRGGAEALTLLCVSPVNRHITVTAGQCTDQAVRRGWAAREDRSRGMELDVHPGLPLKRGR